MSYDQTIDAVTRLLDPAGPQGFEGLIAQLMEVLTRQRFYLSLSGSQGGKDLASGLHSGNILAVECKRYGPSSALNVDSLVAKFSQASIAPIPPDVWILVTTKRLGEQHHTQLTLLGKKTGIDCVLIDAEGGAESDLIALLSVAPEVVADFLERFGRVVPPGRASSIKEWLQARSESGECASILERLRKEMLAGCLGLGHWRNLTGEQLQSLLHDPDRCRAQLGQNLAVLDDQAKLVRRKRLHDGLTAWYKSWPTTHRLCSVLGDEGAGKSWALAHWLADSMTHADSPPVIFLSAGDVGSAEPRDLVVLAVAGTFGLDRPSADKRLQRWLGQPSDGVPLLVLVLDGLNEYPRGPWAALLSGLAIEPWTSRVAVLMTCRTLFWQEQLAPRFPGISTLEIHPFDDQELAQALALRDVARSDIDDRLLPLIRIPRYLDLMVRLRHEMLDSGEVTKERLIYEDQFDRWRRRSSASSNQLNRDQFQEFLHRLAERLLTVDEIPRSEIVNELDAFGTGRDLLEELATGRILERRGPAGWSVNRRYLVLAFGLLLADTARRAATRCEEDLDETICAFLEPQPDMDIKVEICGFALLHALEHMDQGFTLPVRLSLFRAWIQGRNIRERDWARVPAYLPRSPETYLAMAEWLWSRERNHAQAQDAFMAGFLRYAPKLRVHQALVVAFERWFAFVHPDGHPARYWTDDPRRLEKGRTSVRAALGDTPPEGDIELDGFRLGISRDQGLLRLSQVALAVISHLERQPFLRGIVTGMLANTVMGQPDSPELYYWTLRTAPDPIESHLLNHAADLIDRGSKTAQKTADFLLGAINTGQAAALQQTVADAYRYKNPLRELWLADPCRINLFWDEETAELCLPRADLALGAKLRLSEKIALDPATVFPDEFVELATHAEFDFDLDQIASNGNGITSEDHASKEVEAAMCAVAPSCWVEFERRLARELPNREEGALWLLALRVFERLPILSGVERDLIEQRWERLRAQDPPPAHGHFAEDVLFQCVLWGQDANGQLNAYLRRPGRSTYVLGCTAPSAWIPGDVVGRISALLKAGQDDAVTSNLLAFLADGLERMTEDLRETLLTLCRNRQADFGDLCREIFYRHRDRVGMAAIIEGDSLYTDRDAVLNHPTASLLVCEYGASLGFDEVVRRVAPDYLGLAVERRGRRPEEVKRYAQVIDHLLDLPEAGLDSWSAEERSNVIPVDRHSIDDFLPQWEVDDRDGGTFVFMSAGFGWGGNPGRDNTPEGPRFNQTSRELTLRHNDQVGRVRALVDQARGRGNAIFARRFRAEALDAVVAASPGLVASWLERAMTDTSEATYLLVSYRGFYEVLCETLLNLAPTEGVDLYRRLIRIPDFRLVDRATGIDNLVFSLFKAATSGPVDRLRRESIERCTSDLELFELALAAQIGQSQAWFGSQVGNWRASPRPFDRARGIYLLGMLDDPTAESQLSEILSEEGKSWLRSRAQAALRIHRRNQWAKTWFARFLEENDAVCSWAAFRLFLQCVDRRFWLWGADFLETRRVTESARRHYLANRLAIVKVAKANERSALELHRQLVGDRVLDGEAWPWMTRLQRFSPARDV